MKTSERVLWLAASLVLLAIAISGRKAPVPARAVDRLRPQPGIRLSMNALHQQGGVPLGWIPSLAPGNRDAGRDTFAELGCPACHRIAGESLASDATGETGPELTGMGSHHPPAYFAEAILDPDAVLIDEPGYVGVDGHSIMPLYPDMTIGELSDLVAYLTSLRQEGMPSNHAGAATVAMTRVDLGDRPAPQLASSRAYFTQTYDVLPGRLADFESWFASRGRARLVEADGLETVETVVDLARPSAALTTTFGFRDENTLRNFMGDPATSEMWLEFDAFAGPHGHYSTDRPLVYRAQSLSIDADVMRSTD